MNQTIMTYPNIIDMSFYIFFNKKSQILFISGRQKPQEPFSNLTNDTFHFSGPRCWTQFRLNRSEVFRCLRE